jgi:hypothetical protein
MTVSRVHVSTWAAVRLPCLEDFIVMPVCVRSSWLTRSGILGVSCRVNAKSLNCTTVYDGLMTDRRVHFHHGQGSIVNGVVPSL